MTQEVIFFYNLNLDKLVLLVSIYKIITLIGYIIKIFVIRTGIWAKIPGPSKIYNHTVFNISSITTEITNSSNNNRGSVTFLLCRNKL